MRWAEIGAICGAVTGAALILITLAVFPLPSKAPPVGFNAPFAWYAVAIAAGWALIGMVPGLILGALVGPLLPKQQRSRKS
jgi:hypothetical protein